MLEVLTGLVIGVAKEPVAKMLPEKSISKFLGLLISVASIAWLLSAVIGAGSPTIPDRPSVIGSKILEYFSLPTPTGVGDVSGWIQGHPRLLRGVAVFAGISIGLSGRRTGFFAGGGGSPIAWLAVLLAVEGLGATSVLIITSLTFVAILAISGLLAIGKVGSGKNSSSLMKFDGYSWGSGLGDNLIQFVFFPFLVPLLLPWLFSGYAEDKRESPTETGAAVSEGLGTGPAAPPHS